MCHRHCYTSVLRRSIPSGSPNCFIRSGVKRAVGCDWALPVVGWGLPDLVHGPQSPLAAVWPPLASVSTTGVGG